MNDLLLAFLRKRAAMMLEAQGVRRRQAAAEVLGKRYSPIILDSDALKLRDTLLGARLEEHAR